MITRSLVGKIWLTMVILVILVMFLLGFFLSQFFEDFYFSLKSQELQKNGIKIAELIASSPDLNDWETELYVLNKYTDASLVITDRAGLIRASTLKGRGMMRGQKFPYPDVEKILEGKVVAQRGTYPGISTTVLSVGVPITIENNVIGAVLLHSPVEPVTKTVRTVQMFILYGAVGTILLAAVLGFILSKKLSQPILDMNRVAMEMARGNFTEKISSSTEDELGLLGQTLNYLSSELHKNLEFLSDEKEHLKNILTSMTDAVITFDAKGNVPLMNPPARKLFNIPAQDQGDNFKDHAEINKLKEYFNAVIKQKENLNEEISVSDRTYKMNMTPLRHDNGEVRGVVAVLHDITKEKQLESLRREFVANVSHELRSPLSLLQGYVEALADGLAENEDERKKYLNILLDETLRLRRLVNDLLDLTQLETGNMNMKAESLPVHELVYRVTDRFQPLFKEQDKKLTVFVPEGLPPIVGDGDKLQQVLVNLVDNAAKYTPPQGIVNVGAVLNVNMVDIFVEDTGPGIHREELGHIWERFYKVDKARTRETAGGTGLGLAIAKNIVLAHHGTVKVESQPGIGTKFTFSIPITASGE